MKAGDIYDVVFPFKPSLHADGSFAKGRPALIISVSQDGTALALMVKITGTAPYNRYPNRVKITYWQEAKLDKLSYAEIDSEEHFNLEDAETYRGTLNPFYLNNILIAYINLNAGR
ncbi:hypothetical protein MKY09_09360 [Psychrobacillus sp. FSL K6-4046]|uniref:hypothetical protein n=1 Tax=Psychrobacillus sp. FSL K6-4046 TaxID=2921550 RepID=UPI00315A6E1F